MSGELGTLPYARTLLDEYVLPMRLEAGEGVTLTNELRPVVDANREKRVVGVWVRTAAGGLFVGRNTTRLETFEAES